MVWRSKRERHEFKNTVTAVIITVIVVAWLASQLWEVLT